MTQLSKEQEALFEKFLESAHAYYRKVSSVGDWIKAQEEFKALLASEISLALSAQKKEIEEVIKKKYFVSPHAPEESGGWNFRRCSDCWCTNQEEHTHYSVVEDILSSLRSPKEDKSKE